jgi:SAM-dependent methyltransferase
LGPSSSVGYRQGGGPDRGARDIAIFIRHLGHFGISAPCPSSRDQTRKSQAMHARYGRTPIRAELSPRPLPVESVATAYNRAGADYVAYADGDPANLFSFEGLHAYADRRLWSLFAAQLSKIRASGASVVSILDAGCGPGTWLRRLVTHARELGFSRISARGFDVAEEQIRIARRMAGDLSAAPGITLNFEIADLSDRLAEADASVDLTLCLYSVLSHLPSAGLSSISAELARVTRGHFVTTVRSIGSTPTIFVDSMEKARHLKLHHRLDRCDVELSDGRRVAVSFHLFTARELRECFSHHFHIEDVCGLDIFHSRFVPDQRWNPASLSADWQLAGQLARLEETYARDTRFMERANHLLLVGSRLPSGNEGAFPQRMNR